jgi:hypothetical protein
LAKRKEPAEKEVADKADKKESAAAVKAASLPVPTPQPKPEKKGKLLPKHKSRLPRRLKKAQKKAAGLL